MDLCASDDTPRTRHHYTVLWPGILNANLIMRKCQTNPEEYSTKEKGGAGGLYSSEMFKVRTEKGRGNAPD